MMALSAPTTPRSNLCTPRRIKKVLGPPQTPECFNKVTVETPVLTRRRSSGNKDKFDELSNLTVAVRVRPMNTRELNCVGTADVVKVKNQEITIRSNITGGNSLSLDHIFQYDHVFWSCDENSKNYTSQEDVFDRIGKPLLDSAFKGYNACLFAYGQTGSGKSYSMMGENTGDVIDIDINAGITPRFCKELFARIDGECSASVEVSFFEIYNEKIHDLLATQSTANRMPLKVREHPVWGPYVVDLSVHTVKSYKELRSWLLLGNKNRATAATAMNEKSSRSHSIFSIEISLSEGNDDGDSCRRSKVSLVDLAGSERLSNGMNNEERIRQGVSINKSLLTLGKVISSLAEQKKANQFVPYRDSVLTWLLRESLGGNSLTCMLATITPASSNLDETLATLRYACQARSIVNRARVNENPHDRLIRELRAEVERLRALRQSYERNSMSLHHSSSLQSINTTHDDDSTASNNQEELDTLRVKLTSTESQLERAQRDWEQRFMETKREQQRELAEVARRKDELESHIRVMTLPETGVSLSPYKTNFLDELESMLCVEDDQRGSTVVVTKKKLTRNEITSAMDQIYGVLGNLRPTVDTGEENVKLLFARVNKLMQAFETALVSNVTEASNHEKTVTFQL